ncbi:hypothetical protein, partial [Methanoregula sp.]|uniref:hypothetical protein n=1 Tax=Methanoregula sp. TaxID=2052170 RepID=UPI003FD78630
GEITTPGGIVPFVVSACHQDRQRRLIEAFARCFSCRMGKCTQQVKRRPVLGSGAGKIFVLVRKHPCMAGSRGSSFVEMPYFSFVIIISVSIRA